MRSDQDAYGHAMLDYLEGRGGAEIVERDDGYLEATPGPRAYFAPFRRWPRTEREARRYVRGRVLDVGCGAGRWALHLQDRGLDVVGIDISPRAIRVCRRRGVEQARVLSVTRVGPALGRFGTILMMGNNFGLLGGERRGRWLLRRFHHLTGEDGRIVAESRDPLQTDSPHHRAYHTRNRRRGRLPGQIRMRIRYRTYRTPWFDYLMVSSRGMRTLLRGTGWGIARILADGPQYVAVIEKQAASRPA